jgi:hypothetical protein
MKKLLVLLFICSVSSALYASFDYTPVLVHLSKDKQHDTVGFNLVEEIPQLFYRRILNGEIILWDSPNKQAKISPEALLAIERSTETSMLNLKDLFLNEIWKSFKRDFEFNLVGFTFMNDNEGGQKVVYGFVDAEDVKLMLKSLIIPTNANGQANLTYWDAIYSASYPFNVVQFGKNTFQKNMMQSLELENTFFKNPKIKSNKVVLKEQKEIHYFMLPNNEKNKVLFGSLGSYLNNNKEFFYNLGGDEIYSPFDPSKKIEISKIEVVEFRQKTNQFQQTTILKFIIYVNGKPLEALDQTSLSKIDMLIDFKTIADYLNAHQNLIILTKINNQEVPAIFSAYYIKALENDAWNKITLSTITE